MYINNPQVFDHIKTYDGEILRIRQLDIGAWDMDTTQQVNIAHGLTWANIRAVTAKVQDDGNTWWLNLDAPILPHGVDGWVACDNTHIVLQRLAGGYFDKPLFSSVLINRGYIQIWYEV